MKKSVRKTAGSNHRVPVKRSASQYVATISPKMSREWDDIAEWMGGVSVDWLIHEALETELRCLNEDKTFRGDMRENYMRDKHHGVKVPLALERVGSATKHAEPLTLDRKTWRRAQVLAKRDGVNVDVLYGRLIEREHSRVFDKKGGAL